MDAIEETMERLEPMDDSVPPECKHCSVSMMVLGQSLAAAVAAWNGRGKNGN